MQPVSSVLLGPVCGNKNFFTDSSLCSAFLNLTFYLTSLEAPKEYRQTAAPILFYNKPKQNVTKTFCSTTVLTKCLKMTSLPTKQLHVALIVWNEIPELGHAHMCFHGYHMHCVNAYCRSLIRIDGNCCRETHVLMAGLGIYQKIL